MLSPSRLERIVHALEHRSDLVPDPRHIDLEQQMAVTSGNLVHETIELEYLSLAAQSSEAAGYQKAYRHNLLQISSRIPTARLAQVREAVAILSDPRLALPHPHSPVNREARRTNVHIIAEAVLALAKQQPPFTDTPPLPGAIEDEEETEITTPDPVGFTSHWEASRQDQRIHNAVNHLFDYDENRAIRPPDYGYTGRLGFASELRVSGVDHHNSMVFSCRPDGITKADLPSPDRKFITIIDYKRSAKSLLPTTEMGKMAQEAISFLTAQLALALPRRIPAEGRTVSVPLKGIRAIPVSVDMKFEYLALDASPPTVIDPAKTLGIDLHSPKDARAVNANFEDLLTAIRANADLLAPILKRR